MKNRTHIMKLSGEHAIVGGDEDIHTYMALPGFQSSRQDVTLRKEQEDTWGTG